MAEIQILLRRAHRPCRARRTAFISGTRRTSSALLRRRRRRSSTWSPPSRSPC